MSDQPAEQATSKSALKKAAKAEKLAAEKAAKAAKQAAAAPASSGKKAAGPSEEELDPSVRNKVGRHEIDPVRSCIAKIRVFVPLNCSDRGWTNTNRYYGSARYMSVEVLRAAYSSIGAIEDGRCGVLSSQV